MVLLLTSPPTNTDISKKRTSQVAAFQGIEMCLLHRKAHKGAAKLQTGRHSNPELEAGMGPPAFELAGVFVTFLGYISARECGSQVKLKAR